MKLTNHRDIMWLNLTNDFRTAIDFLDICFNKRAVSLLWQTGHTIRNYYYKSPIGNFGNDSAFLISEKAYSIDDSCEKLHALSRHDYIKEYAYINNYLIVDLDLIFFTDLYLS